MCLCVEIGMIAVGDYNNRIITIMAIKTANSTLVSLLSGTRDLHSPALNLD